MLVPNIRAEQFYIMPDHVQRGMPQYFLQCKNVTTVHNVKCDAVPSVEEVSACPLRGAIGNRLKSSPDFPPPHTRRATFTAPGVPSCFIDIRL